MAFFWACLGITIACGIDIVKSIPYGIKNLRQDSCFNELSQRSPITRRRCILILRFKRAFCMTLLLRYDFKAFPRPLLYVAQIDCNGPIHIGSVDGAKLKKRYRELQDPLPFPLCILGVKPFDDRDAARAYERYLHERLHEFEIRKTWFCNGDWLKDVVAELVPLPIGKSATMRWSNWSTPPQVQLHLVTSRRRRRRCHRTRFLKGETA